MYRAWVSPRAYAHARVAGRAVGRELIYDIAHGGLRRRVALYLHAARGPDIAPVLALRGQRGFKAPALGYLRRREGVEAAARADARGRLNIGRAGAAGETGAEPLFLGFVCREVEAAGAESELHFEAEARVPRLKRRRYAARAAGGGDEARHAYRLGVLLDLVVGDGAVAARAVDARAEGEVRRVRELDALKEQIRARKREKAPLTHLHAPVRALNGVFKAKQPALEVQLAPYGRAGGQRGAAVPEREKNRRGQVHEVRQGRIFGDGVEHPGGEDAGVQRPRLRPERGISPRAQDAAAGEEHALEKAVVPRSRGGYFPALKADVIPHGAHLRWPGAGRGR